MENSNNGAGKTVLDTLATAQTDLLIEAIKLGSLARIDIKAAIETSPKFQALTGELAGRINQRITEVLKEEFTFELQEAALNIGQEISASVEISVLQGIDSQLFSPENTEGLMTAAVKYSNALNRIRQITGSAVGKIVTDAISTAIGQLQASDFEIETDSAALPSAEEVTQVLNNLTQE